MSHSRHPLFPKGIDESVADLNTKLQYLIDNNIRFRIPADEMTNLTALISKVNEMYEKARNKDTCTKLDVANRNLAIETAETSFRKDINFYIVGNPQATEVDYEALRIPQPGYHPHLPLPTYAPVIRNIISKELGLEITVIDSKTNKQSIPEGAQSIEVYYQLDGNPPPDINDMKERKVSTTMIIHMQFNFEDENKVVYLAFRWIGTRGDYGIWSEIHKKTIIR
jgi:hypothetical protein